MSENAVLNPIRELRERRGITRLELARLLDVDYQALGRAEWGATNNLSRRVAAGLARIGEDPDAYRAQYRRWREAQAGQVRE